MRAFDKFPNKKHGVNIGMEIREESSFVVPMGHVFAKLEENDTTTELDLGRNFIVYEARILMAQLMKFNFQNGDAIANGVTYLAVGTGGPYQIKGQVKRFDPQNPPVPGVDIYNENRPGSFDTNGDGFSDLINEIARNPVTSTFVDGTGAPTLKKTNIVDFSATFDLDQAIGPLVEMAIFGGDQAETPKKGLMVAVKTFPVINKTHNARITFTWRLAF